MPDTLTPRTEAGRTLAAKYGKGLVADAVLAIEAEAYAHIDALTAAVENVRVEGAAYAEEDNWLGGVEAMRTAVLAILRGEPPDPDAQAEAEFLKPIKPQGL